MRNLSGFNKFQWSLITFFNGNRRGTSKMYNKGVGKNRLQLFIWKKYADYDYYGSVSNSKE